LRLAAIDVGKIEGRHRLHESLLVEEGLAGQMDVSRRSAYYFFFVVVFSVVQTTVIGV
jgi:hypothetical protein